MVQMPTGDGEKMFDDVLGGLKSRPDSAKPRIPFFTNISIFTPKRINVAESSHPASIWWWMLSRRTAIVLPLTETRNVARSETKTLDLRVSIFEVPLFVVVSGSEFQIWAAAESPVT